MKCNEAYKYKQRLFREENNESVKLSKNIYNNLRLKYERTNDDEKREEIRKVFEEFKDENKIKRELYKKGKISESQYVEWLNTYRK